MYPCYVGIFICSSVHMNYSSYVCLLSIPFRIFLHIFYLFLELYEKASIVFSENESEAPVNRLPADSVTESIPAPAMSDPVS